MGDDKKISKQPLKLDLKKKKNIYIYIYIYGEHLVLRLIFCRK